MIAALFLSKKLSRSSFSGREISLSSSKNTLTSFFGILLVFYALLIFSFELISNFNGSPSSSLFLIPGFALPASAAFIILFFARDGDSSFRGIKNVYFLLGSIALFCVMLFIVKRPMSYEFYGEDVGEPQALIGMRPLERQAIARLAVSKYYSDSRFAAMLWGFDPKHLMWEVFPKWNGGKWDVRAVTTNSLFLTQTCDFKLDPDGNDLAPITCFGKSAK
ncbi:MAG: hypothetical protein AB7K68_00740 [Bacteriovoracia bacterium]